MDRVSAFLEPHHFFDPLHQQIYETAGKLIHVGKQATPITLTTFFENAEPISASLTVPQYLGTLAANATTIINAEDYGRTVYDLATRRALIIIGEDMVNAAYDSPVDYPPQNADRGSRDAALRSRRAAQVRPGLHGLQHRAHQRRRDGERGLQAVRAPLRPFDRPSSISTPSSAACSDPTFIILAGRPSMGKTALVTNIAYNVAKVFRSEMQPDGDATRP